MQLRPEMRIRMNLYDTDNDTFIDEYEPVIHHKPSGTRYSHTGTHRKRRRKKRMPRQKKLFITCCVLLAVILLGGISAISVKKEITTVKQQASTLKTDLKDILSCLKSKDTDGAEIAVAKLDNSVASLKKTLSRPLWKMASHMPVANKYMKSVNKLIATVDDASDSIIKPAIIVMKDYPLTELKAGDGFNITIINAYLSLLDDIEPKIDEMLATMETINLPMGMNSMISEYSEKIAGMTGSYSELKEYLPLFKAFIGSGEDKTYLLVAQNSSEIRAAGGFPGSIGTIKIRDGILSIGDFKPVREVLAAVASPDANVTSLEEKIFCSWVTSAPDASFIPAFDRVGLIWALAYEEEANEAVDGVVSLTPSIIQSVLSFSDAVTLSDGTLLSGDNATQVLQHDLYYQYMPSNSTSNEGNEIVDALFAETAKVTMANLVGNFDVNKVADYFSIFANGAKDRTIMMWMADEANEELVKNAGCSGMLNYDANEPEIGVFFSFFDPCKLGWFLGIDSTVGEPVVNEDGSRTYDVSVVFSNSISAEERRTSSYIKGNYSGSILGHIQIFAPAGGTITDYDNNAGDRFREEEYKDLQLIYKLSALIRPDDAYEVTFKITTAPGVTAVPKVITTPTLQKYRE